MTDCAAAESPLHDRTISYVWPWLTRRSTDGTTRASKWLSLHASR